MAASYLLLVRHSAPEIIPDLPSARWPLSEVGWRRCASLAERSKAYAPEIVVSSHELKARQTGRLIARALNVALETTEGLHEHVRQAGALTSRVAFEAVLGRFFAEPARLVFGLETADQAHRRFADALGQVLERYPAGSLVVVSHGAVITLWVTRRVGGDPLAFWRRLGLPAAVVFTRPKLKLVEVIENVE